MSFSIVENEKRHTRERDALVESNKKSSPVSIYECGIHIVDPCASGQRQITNAISAHTVKRQMDLITF